MKRWISFLVASLLVLDCAVGEDADDAILAYVNGEALHASDCAVYEDYYTQLYTAQGYDTSDESVQNQIANYAYSDTIEERLLQQYQKLHGFTDLTPEEENELTEQAEQLLAAYRNAFVDAYMGNAQAAVEVTEMLQSEAEIYADAALIAQGITADSCLAYLKSAQAEAKMEETLMGDYQVTDAMCEEAYATYVAEDETAFAQDVPAFEAAV